MDEPRDCCTKQSESERERYMLYVIPSNTNEHIFMTETDSETWRIYTCGCQGGEGGKEGLGVWD